MVASSLFVRRVRLCLLSCLLLLPLAMRGQRLVVRVLTPRMLHLQYDATGVKSASPTDDLVACKRYEQGDYLFVETGQLTLRYLQESLVNPAEKSADNLRISFLLGNHNVIWYPGKDDAMNLRGVLPQMDAIASDVMRDDLLQGLVSRAGWSVVRLHPDTDTSFDWLFLGYGVDYERAISDYRKLFLSESAVCPSPSATPEGQFRGGPWRSLAFAPYLSATATNACGCYYGLDWAAPISDTECYARWMQLSAFLPMKECSMPDSLLLARIDSLDNARAFRRAFELQRTMQPYADSIRAQGLPLCRPLYYDFPRDNQAYVYEDEFLFGTDYLVAPITQPAQEDGMARRAVWLPEGDWYDVVNHRIQTGPSLMKQECYPWEIPYYKKVEKASQP